MPAMLHGTRARHLALAAIVTSLCGASDNGFARLNASPGFQGNPPAVPTVMSIQATDITETGARFNASVNPNGSETTVWFEYGQSTILGAGTAAVNVGAGEASVDVSVNEASLTCGTTYYFRAVASSSVGQGFGTTMVFSTRSCSTLFDLVLQHETTGCMVAWHMNGEALVRQDFLVPPCVSDPTWRLAGSADFDLDGENDLVFQNAASGGIVVWFMDGVVLRGQVWLTPSSVSDPNWRLATVGDFDGDSRADLIIQHQLDGRIVAWLLDGTSLRQQVFLTPDSVSDPDWRIVGSGDLNRSSHRDLIFQHAKSGYVVVWYMKGTTLDGQVWMQPAQPQEGWAVSAVVDLTGDVYPDLVLQRPPAGTMVTWHMFTSWVLGQRWLVPPQVADPSWRIVAPR
jgi:hypothetical protein